MARSALSKQEAVGAAKWMLRTRLLESLCEEDERDAFVRRLEDDLACLVEEGSLTFAEVECGERLDCAVRIYFDDHYLVVRGRVEDGRIEIGRCLDCRWI